MVRKTSGRLPSAQHSAWSSVSHDGSECKARDGRAGSGHVRRPSSAWSLRGTRPGRGGSRASCRPRSSPRPGRPCPRTATGPRRSRMMKPCRPVMARAQPQHPGPEMGTGRRSRNRVLLATEPVVLVAQRPSTRHAPGTSAPPPKTTPAPPTRHTTASRPPSAPPQGNDASPSQHGTAPPPRATPHRASPAKAPSRPRSDAAPVQETCTATQAGSPPQRGSALKSRSLSQNKNPPCRRRRGTSPCDRASCSLPMRRLARQDGIAPAQSARSTPTSSSVHCPIVDHAMSGDGSRCRRRGASMSASTGCCGTDPRFGPAGLCRCAAMQSQSPLAIRYCPMWGVDGRALS